jgi:hypothetical protein
MTRIVSILSICIIALLACRTPRNFGGQYTMDAFNMYAGNNFVRKIQNLPVVYEVSIIDTRGDGNHIIVNGQSIFMDTTQLDQPNYYSYKKRAGELKISPDSLLRSLEAFYRIGVNEFNRDSSYFRFRVVIGFTTSRGYIYSANRELKTGDTLPATSAKNRDARFHVVLAKRVGENWFEYFEVR